MAKKKLTGLNEVVKNLNKEIKKIEGDVGKGLLAAVLFIEGEAIEITPQDFGLLRDTSFAQLGGTLGRPIARVGYTAKYAAWVHEMPMTLKGQPRADFGKTGNRSKFGPQQVVSFGGGTKTGTYWDKGENKFLEKAVRNNIPEILKIIANRAKIK